MENPTPASSGKSPLLKILIIVAIVLAICLCIPIFVIVILSLLGPSVGNVFSEIVTTLEATPY